MFKNSNFNEGYYETLENARCQFIKLLDNNKHYNKILDVGCGAGHFSYQLAKIYKNSTVLGIDIVEEYINTSKNTYNYSNLFFSNKSLFEINEQYNLITLFESLTELLKKEKIDFIISFLKNLLLIDGTLMIIDMFNEDLKRDLKLTKKINNLLGYRYISYKDIIKKTKANFNLIKNEKIVLKGQNLNIEGIAHYISYECMLNNLDNSFKLTPITIWNKMKKRIIKQGNLFIDNCFRVLIFKRRTNGKNNILQK